MNNIIPLVSRPTRNGFYFLGVTSDMYFAASLSGEMNSGYLNLLRNMSVTVLNMSLDDPRNLTIHKHMKDVLIDNWCSLLSFNPELPIVEV